MTGNSWLPTVSLAGLILLLVLLEIAVRKNVQEDELSRPSPPALWARRSVGLLCTLACTVSAIWLIPWAAFLPLTDASGLLPGILFIAFLSIGVLYALRDIEIGE